MTVLVVVFAEVLPKTIAFNAPDRMALAAARPMAFVVRVLGPVLTAIEWLVRQLLRLLGVRIGEEQSILAPHEELRGTVDLLHREGSVEKLDRDMMGGLLDLRDLTVADVMVHRTEMMTVNADDPVEDDRRRRAEVGLHAHPAVARQAGEHHRHPACQGFAARR